MGILHLGSESEFVRIELPRSFSSEGWAQAKVEISVHCFHGSISPYFDVGDFERFYRGLKALYEGLSGKAELLPMERQFSLVISGNGRGQMAVEGAAWSRPAHENKLEFTFELDQTYLPGPLVQLEAMLSRREQDEPQ
jgi:hypothetical protein